MKMLVTTWIKKKIIIIRCWFI